MTNRITIQLLIGMAVVFVGAAIVFAPFGDRTEPFIDFSAILCCVVSGFYVAVDCVRCTNRCKQSVPSQTTIALLILTGLLVYMPYTLRSYRAEQLRLHVTGDVSRVYRSDNHSYESVEITAGDGTVYRIEAIYEPTWRVLKPGDSFEKRAWDPFAYINNKRGRIVTRSPLDDIRGLE